jgi:hypothetical protein
MEVALGIAQSARGRRTAAILPARSSLCWAGLRSGCRRPKSARSTTADGLVQVQDGGHELARNITPREADPCSCRILWRPTPDHPNRDRRTNGTADYSLVQLLHQLSFRANGEKRLLQECSQ